MTTSDRFYEVLGLRPGASRHELKAAYRDLTKVWHPDRFAHDPRLQQKAEEKLKEINEAYEQLMSGKTWRLRMSHSPRASATVVRDHTEQRNSHSPVVPVKSRSLLWLLAPLIVFGCVFAFTIRFLHAKANRQPQAVIEQHTTEPGVGSSNETRPADPQSDRRSNETSVTSRQITEQQRLPTTTVIVDSTTGLLARDECPTKVSMTYPAGSEPRAYCNIHPATRSSKLKSLQKHTDSSTDETEKNPQEPNRF